MIISASRRTDIPILFRVVIESATMEFHMPPVLTRV